MQVILTRTPIIEFVPEAKGYGGYLDLTVPEAQTSAFRGFISFRDGILPPPELKEGDTLSVLGQVDTARKLFLIIEHEPA